MERVWARLIVLLGALTSLACLAGCERPTHDPSQLRAIAAESRMLMRTYPMQDAVEVPPARMPAAIAGLRPHFVTIDADGVSISTKPNFDGGCGYFVPRDGQTLPEPTERFSDLGQGVYWYHPY